MLDKFAYNIELPLSDTPPTPPRHRLLSGKPHSHPYGSFAAPSARRIHSSISHCLATTLRSRYAQPVRYHYYRWTRPTPIVAPATQSAARPFAHRETAGRTIALAAWPGNCRSHRPVPLRMVLSEPCFAWGRFVA